MLFFTNYECYNCTTVSQLLLKNCLCRYNIRPREKVRERKREGERKRERERERENRHVHCPQFPRTNNTRYIPTMKVQRARISQRNITPTQEIMASSSKQMCRLFLGTKLQYNCGLRGTFFVVFLEIFGAFSNMFRYKLYCHLPCKDLKN